MLGLSSADDVVSHAKARGWAIDVAAGNISVSVVVVICFMSISQLSSQSNNQPVNQLINSHLSTNQPSKYSTVDSWLALCSLDSPSAAFQTLTHRTPPRFFHAS
jgi:hypothetical protein